MAGLRSPLGPGLAALALLWASAAAGQGRVTAAEVAAAVPEASVGLPLRIDEVTQVVGIRAEGTAFVYDVRIARPLASAEVRRFRREFQVHTRATVCADPAAVAFLRRRGSFRHRYTDTTGFRFETRVTSCP